MRRRKVWMGIRSPMTLTLYSSKHKTTKASSRITVFLVLMLFFLSVAYWFEIDDNDWFEIDAIDIIVHKEPLEEKKVMENLTSISIPTKQRHNKTIVVPVFYNVYAHPKRKIRIDIAKDIFKEQMALLRPEHKVFVRSIGSRIDIYNATHIRHDENGDETGTLGLLWDHCRERENLGGKVVYIHNKGSFNPKPKNDVLRRFMTRGALSEECSNMPTTCNVCSSRMSPVPHAHTSGNMWVARCDYVKKLIDPLKFEEAMRTKVNPKEGEESCNGMGRFAAEHWIHSHPGVRPCDLSTSSDFTWAYENVPEGEFEKRLEAAPRFELTKYRKKFYERKYCGPPKPLSKILSEYRDLYDETPTATWWGWDLYNVTTEGIVSSRAGVA